MFRLDTKTKNYVFNNMVNGCKNNGFDYTASLDNNGNIKALKITHNNVTYNISDIGWLVKGAANNENCGLLPGINRQGRAA